MRGDSRIPEEWEELGGRVRAARSVVLEGLGVRGGLALRQPGVEVGVEREEALRCLGSAHRGVQEALGLGGRGMCLAEQVHGAEVAVVSEGGMSGGVDGLVSGEPGVCLGIYVADCCAVYLVDVRRRVIGLVHSGAKGTRLGVVPAALAVMERDFGCVGSDVVAVLSPCIRPPRYEVDFAAEIRAQCAGRGVRQVHDSGACTGSDLERYYSYRMEKGRTGRMLALLGLR